MSSVGKFFTRAFTMDNDPPGMPSPPARTDESIAEAQRRARRAARQATGLGDTVLTGALGDPTGPNSSKKQLLG